MPAIEKLQIKGFKAFPNEFELNLDGKHLLLYGENGSGKSSIYYALHCLFQSPFKQDGGKKYFDKQNPQNLININSSDEDSHVTLTLMPPHPWIYIINKDGYNTELLGGVKPIPGDLYNNVFINHKFISNISSCRNSEDIDLFPVFYKDIFPYILTRDKKHILADIYEYIIKNPSRRKEYQKSIDYLNQETKYWIDSMNLNISNIYNDSFRNDGDKKLRIQLIFKDSPETVNNELIYYCGRYDYRTYKEVIANNLVVKKAHYKSFIEPHIGLSIEEIATDGSSRKIDKPQTYFNEAKLTAIALAIRFSILDTVSDANGRFMALDDMLISLDMSNRAKVVDFLLCISDKYKIYLFTHDRAFFEYFKHKTKNSSSQWLCEEIYMDDDKCPYLRDSKTYLGQAKHYLKQHEYEIAGNFLRKEAESFCKRFLPSRWLLAKDYTQLDLNGLIINCRKFASESGMLNIAIFDELDEHRKFILNPSSHDSYDVAKYQYEVNRCLHCLDALNKIVVRPFLKMGTKIEFTLKTIPPNINEFKFIITLCDEFHIIEAPAQPLIISKGMINYIVVKNGDSQKMQSDNTTLKRFYDSLYKKSDQTASSDFLDEMQEYIDKKPIKEYI